MGYEEEWRPVPDFPNYEISDKCRVRNLATGYILRPVFDPRSGYVRYCFRYQGRQLTKNAHRIMWRAFRGEIPDGLQINHLDGNTQNNDWSNLELTTQRGNTKHAWDNGLISHKGFGKNPRGRKNSPTGRSRKRRPGSGVVTRKSRLSASDIDEIRAMLAKGVPHKSIAAQKGISHQMVGHIKTGRRLANV